MIGENIAPHMKEFIEKYSPADTHFLGGRPVDYVVFNGYGKVKDTNEPLQEVVFVEVKTSKLGKGKPDKNESKIRDAIQEGRVRYDVVSIMYDEGNTSQ